MDFRQRLMMRDIERAEVEEEYEEERVEKKMQSTCSFSFRMVRNLKI